MGLITLPPVSWCGEVVSVLGVTSTDPALNRPSLSKFKSKEWSSGSQLSLYDTLNLLLVNRHKSNRNFLWCVLKELSVRKTSSLPTVFEAVVLADVGIGLIGRAKHALWASPERSFIRASMGFFCFLLDHCA